MKSKLALSFLVCILINHIYAQLSFPESDTNEKRKPQGHDRQPITSTKCGVGELFYPGDNPGDWVCDCRPQYLYHPQTKTCYQSYSRGPCQQNEILVLQKKSKKAVPVCQQNECGDGNIKHENVCTQIESTVGCKQPKGQMIYKVLVNPSTHQLYCGLEGRVVNRVGEEDEEDENYHRGNETCFAGGKRECGSVI